ncbi:hypothetical protein OHJ21_19330 [Virgibacillus sp. LDC1]|nr:hypothetical protein [Virgibacillus sp. LDC1]
MSEQNKIEQIKARLMAITPGSWHVQPGSPYDAVYSSQETSLTVVASRTMTSDAWFIAKSPEYITYLLQEIERKDEALNEIELILTDDTSTQAIEINQVINRAREAI